jgi:hypothetical protein
MRSLPVILTLQGKQEKYAVKKRMVVPAGPTLKRWSFSGAALNSLRILNND